MLTKRCLSNAFLHEGYKLLSHINFFYARKMFYAISTTHSINPFYTSDSLMQSLANSKYPDEIPHNAALYQSVTKTILRERDAILYGNYNK